MNYKIILDTYVRPRIGIMYAKKITIEMAQELYEKYKIITLTKPNHITWQNNCYFYKEEGQ